ncbi:MAG: hypothetical protein ABIQ95_00265 [Bdellovibrionia bacterium]
MKKSLLLIASLLLSVSAFADSPNFSMLGDSEMDMDKFHQCLCDSWKKADPSKDQNSEAKAFIGRAKETWDHNKVAVKTAKKELIAAWSHYPIFASDVTCAEYNLHQAIIPVHTVMRDSTLSILNILSGDQRKAFDRSFKRCIKDNHEETLSEESSLLLN